MKKGAKEFEFSKLSKPCWTWYRCQVREVTKCTKYFISVRPLSGIHIYFEFEYYYSVCVSYYVARALN